MISIIIPAYNEEKLIETCLKSVQNQNTKNPFEIIVVDNNSTDRTAELASKMGAKVIDEPRQGPALAKNAGARLAQGEILCFIDADCVIPSDHLEKISNLFNKFPEVVAFGGPCVFIDGGIVVNVLTHTFKYFYFYHKFIALVTGVISMPGGNMAIKQGAFNSLNGFNEKLNSVLFPEDLDFSIRLKNAGYKARFLRELQVTTAFRKRAPRTLETIKLILRNFQKTQSENR